MKITQVDLYEVEIPPIAPIARYFPKIYDITLCRVQTDEGLVGWGVRERALPCGLPKHCRTRPAGVGPLADAFTCALLDIAGRAYGLPHIAFGQQVRDRVTVSYWSCPMEPHETAAEAEVGQRPEFKNHKLKARSWNIVETARQMKEATGPECERRRSQHRIALLPTATR